MSFTLRFHRLRLKFGKELPALAQFSLSSLRCLYSHLTASEQYSLYVAARNAIAVSQRRGEVVTLEYWSGRPVVSVEVVPWVLTKQG